MNINGPRVILPRWKYIVKQDLTQMKSPYLMENSYKNRDSLHRRIQRGLTLVELLIALSVIALTAVLLLPVFQSIRSTSGTVKCVTNIKSIGVALTAYAADHQQYLPPTRRDFVPPFMGSYPRLYWTSLLTSYFEIPLSQQVGQKTMRCPLSPNFKPEEGHNYTYGLHYGKASAHDQMLNGTLDHHAPTSYYQRGYIQRLTDLGGNVFLLADCDGKDYPIVYYAGSEGNWPLNQDKSNTGVPDSSSILGAVPHNAIRFEHPGRRANFLLANGTVKSLSIHQWAANENELWGRPWR